MKFGKRFKECAKAGHALGTDLDGDKLCWSCATACDTCGVVITADDAWQQAFSPEAKEPLFMQRHSVWLKRQDGFRGNQYAVVCGACFATLSPKE